MWPSTSSLLLSALCIFDLSLAQSTFPPQPVGLTEVVSKKFPGASFSYKQVSRPDPWPSTQSPNTYRRPTDKPPQTSICETTPGVKAWSGYVHMPQDVLNKVPDVHVTYDINLYFWYFGPSPSLPSQQHQQQQRHLS